MPASLHQARRFIHLFSGLLFASALAGCLATPEQIAGTEGVTGTTPGADAGRPPPPPPPGPAPDLGHPPPPPGSMPDMALPGSGPTDLAMTPNPVVDAGACNNQAVTTAGVECAYTHNAYNASTSVRMNSTVAWSCTQTNRVVSGNGIPDHDTGTFPNANCPNAIAAQTVNATLPLNPVLAGMSTRPGPVGYARNGVKFDPSTAGTCWVSNGQTSCSLIGNTGNWNIEALGQKSFNFGVDSSNAHVQPGGSYHYHGMPTGLIDGLGKGQAMTLVGFALDGFPVYARYGYSVATDAKSPLKALTGSYRLKAQPDNGRPSTNTYPMGAFTQDYEYAQGSGDLDECNGRSGVTPEFPCGIYHYVITDTYPYIGRCLKGSTNGGGGGGGGGMQPPPDGGMMPPPADGGVMNGPKSCKVNADCAGACGQMAKGCVCGQTPMGLACIPTCTVNADCPAGLNGMMLFCRGGVCAP